MALARPRSTPLNKAYSDRAVKRKPIAMMTGI
jgi:hypothetical protein